MVDAVTSQRRILRGTESHRSWRWLQKLKSSRCELVMNWRSGTWRRINLGTRVAGTRRPERRCLLGRCRHPGHHDINAARAIELWDVNTLELLDYPTRPCGRRWRTGVLAGWESPGFRERRRRREALGRRSPRRTADAARSIPPMSALRSRPMAEPLPFAQSRMARPGSISSRRQLPEDLNAEENP